MNIISDGHTLTLSELRAAWTGPITLSLGEQARSAVARSQASVTDVIASGQTVYGVNTGFGELARVRISDDELSHLQENLIRSHAVGVGEALGAGEVRLAMLMKVAALARGFSGVRPEVIEALCHLVSQDICPLVPAQGSVGASGDLAPLAHMAGALLGHGEVMMGGKRISAADALKKTGLEPLRLAPKEGLALLNGTQVSTALALSALFRAERVLAASVCAGALSLDAIKGSDTPFDPRIHELRNHAGQAAIAALLRDLTAGSTIRASHVECNRVQDPYSIRCQPQVTGACLGVMQHVAAVLGAESNAVTDNPLVFPDSGEVLSGGNFHAQPVAFAADYLALAIAEIGSLSERRIALLIDSHLSGLPAFLVQGSGLNSGFMMAQVTAAALASENKSIAHPASVDSLPTSANQEDHVSMATFAARRLGGILSNVSRIVAIELLAAVQGVEFRLPEQTSPLLQRVSKRVRDVSAPYTEDRSLAPDIEVLAGIIEAGEFCEYAQAVLPSYAS